MNPVPAILTDDIFIAFLKCPYKASASSFEGKPGKYRSNNGFSINSPRKMKDRQFAALLSGMDDAVGLVMSKLAELGLEENTFVFFISDNGAPPGRGGNGVLRGGKYTAWEGGVRLPFMVQWKGKLPEGKTYDFAGFFFMKENVLL